MIEGLVMEVHKNYVIVLSSGGEYLKLKKAGNVNIGDVYSGKEYKIFIPRYAAAAVMLFFITAFGGYTAYANQIVGVVNITGTKDVKLYISRNGQVKKVEGLKDASSLKNMPVDKAVEKVNTIGKKEGIFKDSEAVKVDTTKLKSSQVNLEDVKNKIETTVNKNNSNKIDKKTPENIEKKIDSKDKTTKHDDKKDIPNNDAKGNDNKANQDIQKEKNNDNKNNSEDSPSFNNSSNNKKDKTTPNSDKKNIINDNEKKEKNNSKKN